MISIKPTSAELARYIQPSSHAGGIAHFGSHPKDYGGSEHHWLAKNKWRFKVTLDDLRNARMPVGTGDDLQGGCGVYFLFLDAKLQYVGQSKDIRYRVVQHLHSMRPLLSRADWFDSVSAIWVPRAFLDAVEAAYIFNAKPPRNALTKPLTEWAKMAGGIRQSHRRNHDRITTAIDAAIDNQEVTDAI